MRFCYCYGCRLCCWGRTCLALVCDLTIAAENAIFGQTGPKVGSFDAGYGSSIMSQLVYTASEVERMGFVNTIVPVEKLEQETVKWCREILRNRPTAIRVLKSALNAVDDGHAELQVYGLIKKCCCDFLLKI